MFCASVDDYNNVLLLVNQVAAIKNIISVTKHSLKSKKITFRKQICKCKFTLQETMLPLYNEVKTVNQRYRINDTLFYIGSLFY